VNEAILNDPVSTDENGLEKELQALCDASGLSDEKIGAAHAAMLMGMIRMQHAIDSISVLGQAEKSAVFDLAVSLLQKVTRSGSKKFLTMQSNSRGDEPPSTERRA
jgi:hypothetical protein